MLLKALVVAQDGVPAYRERWDRMSIQTVTTSYDYVLNVINAPASAETMFDAVVICCTDSAEEESDNSTHGTPSSARSLADQIRSLPHETAMLDGRKWVAIPVILICPGDSHTVVLDALAVAATPILDDIRVEMPNDENNLGADAVLEEIEKYRLKLLVAQCNFVHRHKITRLRRNGETRQWSESRARVLKPLLKKTIMSHALRIARYQQLVLRGYGPAGGDSGAERSCGFPLIPGMAGGLRTSAIKHLRPRGGRR
jgi:hypothetical protein